MTEKESNNLYKSMLNILNWDDPKLGLFTYIISPNDWYEIQVTYADFTDGKSHPKCKLYFVGFSRNKDGRVESFERKFLCKGFLTDCMNAAYNDYSENEQVIGLQ